MAELQAGAQQAGTDLIRARRTVVLINMGGGKRSGAASKIERLLAAVPPIERYGEVCCWRVADRPRKGGTLALVNWGIDREGDGWDDAVFKPFDQWAEGRGPIESMLLPGLPLRSS